MTGRRKKSDGEGPDRPGMFGSFSPWDWVERLYDINLESVERIAVVETRVDRLEQAVAANSTSDIRVEITGLKTELAELTRVRRDGAELVGKLKYDVIRYILMAAMGALGTLLTLGIHSWMARAGG
jgi:hypothetical protein